MQYRGDPVRLRSSSRTSVGQVRENNEDNIHLWEQNDAVLAIVADGMGGAAAGEEASRLAVKAIQDGLVASEIPVLEVLEKLAEESIGEKLSDIIRTANADILARAAASPEMYGMGTTVTLAFVHNMQVIVAHVGDSRAYLVRKHDGKVTQITADHSFVEVLLASGHITEEQAEEHPMKSVLYRALGQADELDVDVYHSHLLPGDRLVLCSDGLTRHVRANEIGELALADNNPERISQRLIDLANQRGGEDNVSVIVIVLENGSLPGEGDEDTDGRVAAPPDDDTLILRDQDRPKSRRKSASRSPRGDGKNGP